jgi:hypothetical protein
VFFFFLAVLDSTAAPFQNLDFEQANTNSIFTDSGIGAVVGPIQDLLPGWSIEESGLDFFGVPTTNSIQYLFFRSPQQLPLGTWESLSDIDLMPTFPKTGNYTKTVAQANPRFAAHLGNPISPAAAYGSYS